LNQAVLVTRLNLNQVNQFGHSNLIVPYNGNILVFFGIGGQDKWANLGYEAVSHLHFVITRRV